MGTDRHMQIRSFMHKLPHILYGLGFIPETLNFFNMKHRGVRITQRGEKSFRKLSFLTDFTGECECDTEH